MITKEQLNARGDVARLKQTKEDGTEAKGHIHLGMHETWLLYLSESAYEKSHMVVGKGISKSVFWNILG